MLYWNEKALKEKDRLKEYVEAKNEIKKVFDKIFSEFDIIISPVTCCLPVENDLNSNTKGPEYISGQKVDQLIGFALTYIVNFIGNPACSIPAGFMKHHLPIGLQIIGKYMDDETVIQVASGYERINPYISNK